MYVNKMEGVVKLYFNVCNIEYDIAPSIIKGRWNVMLHNIHNYG